MSGSAYIVGNPISLINKIQIKHPAVFFASSLCSRWNNRYEQGQTANSGMSHDSHISRFSLTHTTSTIYRPSCPSRTTQSDRGNRGVIPGHCCVTPGHDERFPRSRKEPSGYVRSWLSASDLCPETTAMFPAQQQQQQHSVVCVCQTFTKFQCFCVW